MTRQKKKKKKKTQSQYNKYWKIQTESRFRKPNKWQRFSYLVSPKTIFRKTLAESWAKLIDTRICKVEIIIKLGTKQINRKLKINRPFFVCLYPFNIWGLLFNNSFEFGYIATLPVSLPYREGKIYQPPWNYEFPYNFPLENIVALYLFFMSFICLESEVLCMFL